jgi:hypothetical protein
MDADTRKAIHAILLSCVERAIKRVKTDATFRPFHEALISPELVRASAFERSFSTSFGQGPMETIAELVAKSTGATTKRGNVVTVTIPNSVDVAINDIIAELRSNARKPAWDDEIKQLGGFAGRATITKNVRSDLWFAREGKEHFFSIKTVKPNMDQTEIAKRDLLTLKASDPNREVFFALYYNPGGPLRADYDWSFPFQFFDMVSDPCVLIGEDYWDFLGGTGTYHELLNIFGEVGDKTKKSLLEE